MPRSSIFHRNRSQASLNTHDVNDQRSYQPSPIESPLHSPGFSRSPVAPTLGSEEEGDRYYQPYSTEEARGPGVQRSQSQRVHQPTIHLVPSPSQGSAEPPAFDDNPDSYYQQQPTPIIPREEPRRRGIFSLKNSSITKEPANNTGGSRLGRSISVRKKVPAPGLTTGTSSGTYPPSSRDDVNVDGGTTVVRSHLQPGPPPPEKDLRSSQLQSATQSDHPHNRPPLQGVVTKPSTRQPLERQGSSNSSAWEKTISTTQQQQQNRAQPEQIQPQPSYQHSPSSATSTSSQPLHQQPPSFQPSPSSATSTSSHPFQSRAPPGALHQLYNEKKTSRPSSQQSFGPPSPLHPPPRVVDNSQPKTSTNPGPPTPYLQGQMGPPPPLHQQTQTRRSDEFAPQQQPIGISREGPAYQAYHQGAQSQTQQSGAPQQYREQLGVNNSQGNNQRAPPQSSPMAPQNTSDQGRSTPPPSRSRDDLAGLDIAQLLQRHDELQDKYRKVKKYYFDKDAQVQQLQNTLAHQRLSQSRTSLDDNEYASRFQRLDGAINNLAFISRREWRSVPPWLAPYVNKEATTSATKETTAIGRACISRWLVDEIFDRYFHPSLDPTFSAHLKIIEKNLRRFAPPTPSDEEKEALIARISNWRLSTLDGLSELLVSPQAAEYRTALSESLKERLTESLAINLKQPLSPDVQQGVVSIIDLAMGIATNLPLESRDVFVGYITPGALISEAYMKIETGLPTLTNPGSSEVHDSDKSSEETTLEGGGKDGTTDDSGSVEERGVQQQQQQQRPGSVTAGKEAAAASKKKGGVFGGFMGGKKAGAIPGGSGPQAVQHLQQQQQQKAEERVRFAAFLVVEVRGRSVLCKAPVYTL